MFAFLNNDHEANAPRLHAREQSECRRHLATDPRDRGSLKHATPDWRDRMAAWEDVGQGRSAEWPSSADQSSDISTGGQSSSPRKTARCWRQGYAPAKFNYDFDATTDLPRSRAFRLELLNDPNLPLNGPGRSFKGTCTLTEFVVEAADADEPGKKKRSSSSRRRPTTRNRGPRPGADFDDRSGRKRVTGPVDFAIDGKDDTAWGIDAGPGRRNIDRKAVFVAEKPVAFPARTVLTFHLVQKHGGWNNNDHQSQPRPVPPLA